MVLVPRRRDEDWETDNSVATIDQVPKFLIYTQLFVVHSSMDGTQFNENSSKIASTVTLIN